MQCYFVFFLGTFILLLSLLDLMTFSHQGNCTTLSKHWFWATFLSQQFKPPPTPAANLPARMLVQLVLFIQVPSSPEMVQLMQEPKTHTPCTSFSHAFIWPILLQHHRSLRLGLDWHWVQLDQLQIDFGKVVPCQEEEQGTADAVIDTNMLE